MTSDRTADIYTGESAAAAIRERYEEQLAAWPVPAERHDLHTRAGRTFALTCGPDDGPAVVLLHGSGANSAVWADGIGELARDHRVVLVDLLGVADAAFVGLSLGGWTATDFATRHPERVRRLALLCPAGIGRQTIGKIAPAFVLSMLGARGRRRSVELITGLDAREHAGVVEEIGRHFGYFRPRTGRFPVFDDDRLRRLTMPVLAVVGARDRVFDSAGTARRLTSLVPRAGVEVLPGAGHALLRQLPRIAEFLRA